MEIDRKQLWQSVLTGLVIAAAVRYLFPSMEDLFRGD